MNYEIMFIVTVAIVLMVFGMITLSHFRREFIVPEGYAGLLYHQGKFVELLRAGCHVRWGRDFTLDAHDLRRTTLAAVGQEVLTADNVALKFNLAVTYQVTDPVKASHETQNWRGDLYQFAQLALRVAVGAITVEALPGLRAQLDAQLLERVQPQAAQIGITVHAVEIKDVMFPAELKRAFAEALKSKHEGIAALERARSESAALRSLANTARLLEGNPALMNLRLLQSLTAAQAAGQTLVFGMPGGFMPLKNGKSLPLTENPNDA